MRGRSAAPAAKLPYDRPDMSPDENAYLAPEQKARQRIDTMLARAGWVVQDYRSVNLYAGLGVAVRELVTDAGPADYVLFVNRQAVGIIEVKKQGTTLSGVEPQTLKYQANVPRALPSYLVGGLLPHGYESTGEETWFTCRMDPEPTARSMLWFLQGTDNLPSPGVIAAEIVGDLEAALAEFAELAESLQRIGLATEDRD